MKKNLYSLIFFTLIIGLLVKCGNNSGSNNNSGGKDTPKADAAKKAEAPENWIYTSTPDKMGKGELKTAVATSTNTLSFKFPYDGEQHAYLTIRNKSDGKEVYISVEKGQFLTDIEGTSVLVRFDSSKAEKFSASGPADLSTTVLFLMPYDKFVSKLKNSKTVNIQATFYDEGYHVLEFNTAGFKW